MEKRSAYWTHDDEAAKDVGHVTLDDLRRVWEMLERPTDQIEDRCPVYPWEYDRLVAELGSRYVDAHYIKVAGRIPTP